MIRDTSAQDRVITAPAGDVRKRRLWVLGGATLVAIALAASWPALSRRLGADQSISGESGSVAALPRPDRTPTACRRWAGLRRA